MTEKAIKKLDEQLNCTICFDTYTDPKLLQCFHTYCTKCLIPLVIRDTQGQFILPCPTCRQVTPIPPNGVRGLQSAFQINEFISIRDDLKTSLSNSTSPEDNMLYCSEHAGKEVELYCSTCNELICWKCVAKGGKHHDHNYDPINLAFEKYKGEITSSLEPMEKQLKTIHTALEQLDTRSEEIFHQRVNIEASIHDNINKLQEILNSRRTELVDQLQELTQEKLKGLTSQRDHMEIIFTRLRKCIIFIKESLNSSKRGHVLKMKPTISEQVMKCSTPIQADILRPSTEADMKYLSSPDVNTLCGQYTVWPNVFSLLSKPLQLLRPW